ncbi:hypothetical protein ZIOFF_040068 [Zingiber officinale]|uniref:DUF4216 domain-containing protein n=1 Tax=Zingiber officinale TaxID=94328 RepID=A0A8J5G2B4_ZINOF|nr:hypothetical protein ZIOFF_040068 [Zingiber officinale]
MRAVGSSEATDELYALANRSNFSAYSYSGAIINGVKFLVEQQDCKWFDTDPTRRRIQEDNKFMSIYTGAEWYKNDPFILASQAKSVYYLNDIKNGPMWKLVQAYASHNLWDYPNIEVENDVDKTTTDAHVVQELNSQPLQLVVELPELENVSFYHDDIEPTENKFEYEKTNLVMEEVERLAMRAIQEGRCKMRRHWKQLGGLGNKDSPKRKSYKGEISEKNTNNRFNRPLEGAHGSKTLVQHYHTAADPVTGELPSVIDTFEKFFHKGGQWKNDWAAQKHAEMVDLRLTQSKSEEFTFTVDNVRQPKDVNIMMQVLGSWSRYVKGLGPLPKLSVVGGSRATNISSKYHNDYGKFATMQKTIDEQNLTIREQHQKFEALLHQLQQVIPGFSFQSPPTCSSIRPPPPPPPPPSSTM